MDNASVMRLIPQGLRFPLKRLRYHWQISRGLFRSPEPEYATLSRYCGRGDWVLDIGANVGHYTYRLSELVGPTGRVFALEPVPETFALLSSNLERFPHPNVTLLNLAASDETGVIHIAIPRENSVNNLYLSRIDPAGECPVFGYRVDDLRLGQQVSLVKIDVEGHELPVIRGMRRLLETDHPTLIVEGRCDDVRSTLAGLSYRADAIDGSPNQVFSFVPPAS